MTTNPWKLNMGANLEMDGSATFRVWSPYAKSMSVKLFGEFPKTYSMKKITGDIFEVQVPEVPPDKDYIFLINDEKERPDPLSRCQPYDVHGPSRIVDPNSFKWSDDSWQGINLKDYIIYELHTATFTPEGTFKAIIPKLPYLKELGINAIELMPVAQYPGERNWGYDGVYPYAPQSSYGEPDDLKKLINAAHNEGIAVILDVVYNHLGPEGSYLAEFAPYFTDKYKTPWGQAINYDDAYSNSVRKYFIDNALYWLSEYHIDSLRLDAIHAIFDFSARHFLEQLQDEFQSLATELNRKSYLIAESDLNDVRVIRSKGAHGLGIDAQWSDDFHHSMQSYLLGISQGYFGDFGKLADIKKAMTDGFVNDGCYSNFRKRFHGSSSTDNFGKRFVICLQNHDQIANAFQGKRMASLLDLEQQKLATAILFFSPFIPLIFMGQEWGEVNPFLYFTSHTDPELAQAVTKGYQKEYASFQGNETSIDPQDPKTFEKCKLNWGSLNITPHQEILHFYKDMIKLRKNTPCLSNCRKDLSSVYIDENKKWLIITREVHNEKAILICNMSNHSQSINYMFPQGKWNLLIDSAHIIYGGDDSDSTNLESLDLSDAKEISLRRSPFSACIFHKVS